MRKEDRSIKCYNAKSNMLGKPSMTWNAPVRKNVQNIQAFHRGGTSAETLMTMLLVIILSLGLFSLTMTSVRAYQRISDHKTISTDLRVAASFVSMKIRQNDRTGCLDIRQYPGNGQNSLVVEENIDGMDYETWVFSSQGYLWEAIVPKGETPSEAISNKISKADSFSIIYDKGSKGFSISLEVKGEKPYEYFISRRSD